jgi:colanic acid biosynthesis glycosyl transferase WcaI
MDGRPLHIAYLVQQFPPEVGAGPARVTEMALRWQARGARVSVITAMPARAIPGRAFGEGDPQYRGRTFAIEHWNGLRVLRSWAYRATKPGFARVVANNVSFMATSFAHAMSQLEDADVLIASSPPLFPHFSGAAVSAMRGIPLVLEIRDLWPDYLVDMGMLSAGSIATRALFGIEQRLLRMADHVVVVTESFRKRVIAKGARPEQVSVFPNGVDTTRYGPSASASALPALAKRPGEFLVGYLGTFGAGQDLASVVEAAAIVSGRDRAVRFVLAGDGLQRDHVVRLIADRHVSNVTVLPPIPKEDTPAFYSTCDVCLVPLAPIRVFQETVPSKIFEVMACERPVLASLAGEGQQIVERSGAGIVVPPGDASAIADGVSRLKAMSTELRARMGAAGRVFVAEHYDRIRIADHYLDALHAIADSRHGRLRFHRQPAL